MRALIVLVVLWLPAWGQSDFRRHTFTANLGSALPKQDLEPFFEQSFMAGGSYGYRFLRYFQADGGLDVVFGAARVRDFLDVGFPLRIRDRQYFANFGGRAILPLARDRVHFFGGGGGSYMRYAEVLDQPFDYARFACDVCDARDGWGYYALAGANLALDRGQHFRVGFTSKMYGGHTDGQGLGPLPGIRSKDRWLMFAGTVSFSF